MTDMGKGEESNAKSSENGVNGKSEMPGATTGELDADIVDFFANEDGTKRKKKVGSQFFSHFKKARDLKLLFKCSMAVWIMTIFIFIDETLRVIGQATFFGCIVLFFIPPSGVLLVQLLGGLTVVIGLCLGWTWGVITMKAALATRPTSDLQAQYAAMQASAPQNTTNVGPASGQTTYQQIAIFDGALLDTRVTVTYYCMMGLFIYLMARLRIKTPKLTLVSIFAIIVADIYVATAPLIPTFNGTLPKSMIIPVSIAIGVGAFCNIVFFPQSTSTIVLGGMSDVFMLMGGFGKALHVHLRDSERRFEMKKLTKLRDDLLAAYKSVDASVKFLPMDFTYSRWSPEDIQSLQEPFRQLFIAFGELLQVPMFREQGKIKADMLQKVGAVDTKNKNAPDGTSKVATHQIAHTIELQEHMRHPDLEAMIAETNEELYTCLRELQPAWTEAVQYISDSLLQKKPKKSEEALNPGEILKRLERAQADFERSAGPRLLKLHEHLLDEHGNVIPDPDGHHPPMLGIMTGLLYVERFNNSATSTLELLRKIVEINQARQKSKLWLPKGLLGLFAWAVSKDDAPDNVQALHRTMTATSKKQSKRKSRKAKKKEKEEKDENGAASRLEEMRKPPGRKRHKTSAFLLGAIEWLTNDEGLFALRMLILTVAIGAPAAIKTSAGFYYREKGLWALIMAQLSLMPYTSEFVGGLLVRVAGTIVGGVIGLVCWYIGSGGGPGNAFGLAAIMAVIILAMMYWRLFAPPEQMQASIMTAATIYLVVAYSWIDTHVPSYGTPGIGYEVFWRRLLLVLIGFTASTIVIFFPRPPSGNRHNRELLADQLTGVKDRYALFVSTWRSPPEDLLTVIEKEALASEELLTSIAGPIKMTKFEFSTSNVDTQTLRYTAHFCTILNVCITQLIIYTHRLSPEYRAKFMQESRSAEEDTVVDVMSVLTLLQQSLLSGTPLPAVLPTPLTANVLHRHPQPRHDRSKTEVIGELTSQEGRHWISAMNAYIRVLGSIDDLVLVLKRSVGEQNMVDLSAFDEEAAETTKLL